MILVVLIGFVLIWVGRLVLVCVFLVVVFLVLFGARHIEAGEQMLHNLAETALILDGVAQSVEIGAGAILDKAPPKLDKFFGVRRRRETGQSLACDQR